MTAVAITQAGLPKPPSPEDVRQRLVHWREVLLQVKSGKDTKTTRGTCWMALDRWLDEAIEQQGTTPLADVWDRVWPATWTRDRMSKET